MKYSSCPLIALCLTTLMVGSCVAAQQHGHAYKNRYEAVEGVHPRSATSASLAPVTVEIAVTGQYTPVSTQPPILSFVFATPGAHPVEITSQSQLVTSYFPEYTWCIAPPIALIPVVTRGRPYLNESTSYLTSLGGTGACETVYATTETTVCATILTGLASKITVTECEQTITFSSECGYSLETPTATSNDVSLTASPTIRTMMTYWNAPWQSLTQGSTPSDVDVKVCKVFDDGELECISYQQVWEVVVMTQTTTTQRQVDITTTVSGPGKLIFETVHMDITGSVESVSLSTTLLLEIEVETETTSKSKKLVTRTEEAEPPTSTVFITKQLKHKPAIPEPTTTVRLTSIATFST